MKKFSYYDFTPILVASMYGARMGADLKAWKVAFLLGVALAGLQYALYRYLKRDLDPFAQGLNLFLLVGAVGYNLEIYFILSLFGEMREAASFIFVTIVGLFFLVFKEEGLLHQEGPGVKLYSLVIVLVSLLSLGISYYFKGDQLLSVSLPFVLLFFLRNYFNKRLPLPAVESVKEQKVEP